MKDHVFNTPDDRPSVTNVLIVITDGYPANYAATVQSAQAAMASMQIFAIGVGGNVATTLLRDISSPPQVFEQNYFNSATFVGLSSIIDQVTTETCKVATSEFILSHHISFALLGLFLHCMSIALGICLFCGTVGDIILIIIPDYYDFGDWSEWICSGTDVQYRTRTCYQYPAQTATADTDCTGPSREEQAVEGNHATELCACMHTVYIYVYIGHLR